MSARPSQSFRQVTPKERLMVDPPKLAGIGAEIGRGLVASEDDAMLTTIRERTDIGRSEEPGLRLDCAGQVGFVELIGQMELGAA